LLFPLSARSSLYISFPWTYWNIYADVGYVKHGQRNIEGVAVEFEVCNEAINFGISNIGSVDERQQP